MAVTRFVGVCCALLLGAPALAAEPLCQSSPLDALIAQGKDLYLGELHGTVESPALVRCLVLAALKRSGEPLIVSLEQESARRDPDSEVWSWTDGRSSQAMWELTQFLLAQEKAKHLTFHQQLGDVEAIAAGNAAPKFDPQEHEIKMGAPLRELAARGQLIALSGNVHSRMSRPFFLQYDPAGMFAGPGLVHVDLESAGGGTAWTCTQGGCGAHAVPAGMFQQPAGSLIDGKQFEHDFIFLLPRFTASPPHSSRKKLARPLAFMFCRGCRR